MYFNNETKNNLAFERLVSLYKVVDNFLVAFLHTTSLFITWQDHFMKANPFSTSTNKLIPQVSRLCVQMVFSVCTISLPECRRFEQTGVRCKDYNGNGWVAPAKPRGWMMSHTIHKVLRSQLWISRNLLFKNMSMFSVCDYMHDISQGETVFHYVLVCCLKPWTHTHWTY